MSMGSVRAGEAYIELTTKDSKLQKGLKNAEARLKSFGDATAKIGQNLMVFWGAVAAPVAMAVKRFADFDDQMRLCQAVTGATGKEFDMLTEKAKKLGRETSFTAAQVAQAMVALGRMGFKPKEIDAAVSSVMNLSRVTGTELAESADIAANTMRIFGIEAGKMSHVSDVLSVTANSSAQTLTDLFEGLKTAGPSAASANEGITDVCTALGVMANMGVKGSLAGTSLRKAYLQMADPKVREYLRGFDIDVLDGNRNLRKMADILTDVAKAMNGMGSADKLSFMKEVFDLRGMTGMQGMTANIAQIDEFKQKLVECAGAAEKGAKKMDEGIGGTLRILASQIEGAAIALGNSLIPFLKGAAAVFTPLIEKVTAFLSANAGMIQGLAKFITRQLLVGAAFFAVGKIISKVSGTIGVLHRGLAWCTTVISVTTGVILKAQSAFANFGAAIVLSREAMTANKGVLSAKAFSDIAGALGIAASGANRYTMAMLAASNAEVGQKAIRWLKNIPDMFSTCCAAIRAYIARTIAATSANVAFSFSSKSVRSSLSGVWTAAAVAAKSMVKYIATIGIAGAATAALGAGVKIASVAVAGLMTALTFLMAHPVVAVITLALAAVAATIAVIARQCSQATEQAKRDAEEAQQAYERATQRTGKGQEDRRKGSYNLEALEKLEKAQETASLSANEIETAVSLINSLKPFGSESWAHIDTVTGKLTLAKNAMEQFQQSAQKRAVLEAEAELKALDAQASAVKKQMATYAGWRDTIWIPGFDSSTEYNEQYEKELDAIRAKQLAAHARLSQAKQGNDQGVYGQEMGKTDADKAAEAERKRQISLEEFQKAQADAAEYEKKLSDGRKSALEREIDSIDEAKKKYVEMLKLMMDYEKTKPENKQDKTKIAEWQKKLDSAQAEADRLKQEARDRESKKATGEINSDRKGFAESQKNVQQRCNENYAQQKLDKLAQSDPEAAAKVLQGLITQSRQMAKQAAAEFQRADAEARKPDKDGVVRYTDEEKARVSAARQNYETSEGRVDTYRAQLQRVQESLAARTETKTVAGFDAREITGLFGGAKADTAAERSAKSSETIEKYVKNILDRLAGASGLTIS